MLNDEWEQRQYTQNIWDITEYIWGFYMCNTCLKNASPGLAQFYPALVLVWLDQEVQSALSN